MYSIAYKRTAEKQLESVPKKQLSKILKTIQALSVDPRPHGVKKLQASENYYRVRSGDYRIIYTIVDKEVLITVVKIGHRKEIYR